MNRPPAPWLHGEAPAEWSAMLKSADADVSDAAIERVRARLHESLGPAFEPEAPQPPSSATHLSSSGPWLGLGAMLALGGLWFASHARHPQPMAAEPRAPAAPIIESPPPQPPSAATLPAPEPEPPQPMAAKPPARSVKRNPVRPAPSELGLAEELRQLAQTRRQLAASPERALAEADAQDQRFPHGTLGAERELLRIDALLRLGRITDARRRAERALSAPGGHPYRAQIEKLLAGK